MFTEEPTAEVGAYRYAVTNTGSRHTKFYVVIEQYVYDTKPRYYLSSYDYDFIDYKGQRVMRCDIKYYFWKILKDKQGFRTRKIAERWATAQIRKISEPLPIPKIKKPKKKWFKAQPNTTPEVHYV